MGNIFHLGTKYTKAMKMTFINEKGEKQNPIRGCYGIGLGRIMACVIEESADNYGPIWNKAIAPFDLEIICISKNEEVKEIANCLYEKLKGKGFDILLDDRGVSPGVAFGDADLIAAPLRVVFGDKNFANGEIELVSRDKSINKKIKWQGACEELAKMLKA
jgi:prolyl-tRNA synthetase